MTKKDAVRLSNQMAGLRPQIVKTNGPKWNSFGVDYSEVTEHSEGGGVILTERRHREV